MNQHPSVRTSRRDLLRHTGTGLGMVALPSLLQAAGSPLVPRSPHFQPRAKHIIHIYLNGGPSQVDTWDPKPELTRWGGKRLPVGNLTTERETGVALASPFKFDQYGESGRAKHEAHEYRRRTFVAAKLWVLADLRSRL